MEQGKSALLHSEQSEAGRELLDLQRREGDVVRDHASTSPGIRVTTLRRCGGKVLRATRWTSAAVIDA